MYSSMCCCDEEPMSHAQIKFRCGWYLVKVVLSQGFDVLVTFLAYVEHPVEKYKIMELDLRMLTLSKD